MLFFQNSARKRITIKLLLYILAFSTFITLITTAINLYVDYAIDMERIENRIQDIRKSNLPSLSQSLWYMDTKYAETQLNGLLQLPDIQYLKIDSDIKENNISAGILQTRNISSYEFPLLHRANDQAYNLGNIRIVVNLNNVYQRLFNKVLIILGTQTLRTFLVPGFIFFIVQWLITRHLVKISNFVQQLNIDNLEEVLQLPRSVAEENELSQVVDAINSMKSDLYQKIRSLRKSEERYLDLYDKGPDMYVSIDAETTAIMECNQTLCHMTGYTKEEIIGASVFFMYHPDCINAAKKALQIFAETGEVHNAELQLKRKNGSRIDVILNVSAVRDNQGRILYSRSSWRDITELKKAQEASKKSEELFQAIFDQAAVGVAQINTQTGQFIRINQKYCDIIGYSIEEMKANTFMELTYPDDLQADLDNMERLVNGEVNSFSMEKRYVHKNGSIVWLTLTVSPMWERGEKPTYHIAVVEDITEKKKIEEEKVTLEARLRQQQKMESIGHLAGGIAHDFNNILYPIMGFTQLSIEHLPKDHPVQENLADILNGAKRARDLVKRILLFSRQKEQEFKPSVLQPVIRESHKLLRSTIPSNIELVLNLYDGEDYILCDSSEIHEVIMNLCTNSYHAMTKDKGRIEIGLKKQPPPSDLNLPRGDYLCLSVKDNGAGIPEKIRDIIFEPYVTTKDVGKGSGLGLSVVYGIVQKYGGDIKIKSVPFEETVFEIFLPVTNRIDTHETPVKRDDSLMTGHERILFVDDEASIVKLGAMALEKAGYKVTGMNRSTEALQVFKSNPGSFDLVITDMAMPGMEGSRLAEEILDIRPDIPILICSGYSEKLEVLRVKELKIAEFIDKPLLVEDLLLKVRQLLDDRETG